MAQPGSCVRASPGGGIPATAEAGSRQAKTTSSDVRLTTKRGTNTVPIAGLKVSTLNGDGADTAQANIQAFRAFGGCLFRHETPQ